MKYDNPNLFAYRSLDEIKREAASKNLRIPFADDLQNKIPLFKKPVEIDGAVCPNRFCIHPVEGCDGDGEGTPRELTFRRYAKFAKGGSGMIWVEATAITPEGRANPRQLMITEKNKDSYKKLVQTIREGAADENGNKIRPYLILQLTHSGRYSKPTGKPEPMIFHHSKVLDPSHNLPGDYPLVTDDYLDALQDKFVTAARLALECGFDAVDVKCTHGYLLPEILSAHTRTDSRYGGSFENRSRMITGVVSRIKDEVPGIAVTSRINVYDGYAYPYGFGMKTDGSMDADLSEPALLFKKLKKLGVNMINIAYGNPYFNPYVERPYDMPSQGVDISAEHPLVTIDRMINLTKEMKDNCGDIISVSVGYTWLREYFPHAAAAVLEEGSADLIGVGRMAFAYPDYANDLFKNGNLSYEKTCITCSSCTQIMRDGGRAGCVIRDSGVYGPIYREGRFNNEVYMRGLTGECRSCWGASCKGKCPAGVDASAFVRAFGEGDLKKAYEIIAEANALPETCSYACPAEELCQSGCAARTLDGEPVPIQQIQRFITKEARARGWTKIKPGAPNGKKVAVIGFGPAGVACAAELIRNGIAVTVFEAGGEAGGTAGGMIPDERMPAGLLNAELEALGLAETGLFEIIYNKKIDEGFTLGDIMGRGYGAAFVAAGLSENTGMPFENKPAGVYSALEFLYKVKRNNFDLSGVSNAAVIGGGNTAMDTAYSLKKYSARNVYLIYRRSRAELPAWPAETERAVSAGVHLLILNQPVGYESRDGKLSGVKITRTVLGEPDSSGRFAPVIVPGSEFTLPADIVVEAVGQKISAGLVGALGGLEIKNGNIIVDKNYMTSRENIFAGGDIINGGKTVVQAVADGRGAARCIINKIS